MDLRFFVLVLFLSSLLLADGNRAQELKKLSREEELNLEKELKLLNKPAVKTIKTEYGDLYACVDFYKQPAFDHPLLKNHTFHPKMRPATQPKMAGEREGRGSKLRRGGIEPSSIGLKGGGCPEGTVPIRRTTREDLIQSKLFSQKLAATSNDDSPGTHHAVLRSKSNPKVKYYGIHGSLSAWNLPVKPSQYTSGQMKIQNGPDSITVGWTVNPNLYGDDQTRLFTYWKAGRTHCINTHCPGFVLMSSQIPLDVVQRVSTRGNPIYSLDLVVYKDKTLGVWWLKLNNWITGDTILGYWPQKIFNNNGLKGFGSYVEWGGESFSPPREPGPGMGSGFTPNGSTNYDAFASTIQVANENNLFSMPTQDITETFVDNPNFYKVINIGDSHTKSFGYYMFYGGYAGITSP